MDKTISVWKERALEMLLQVFLKLGMERLSIVRRLSISLLVEYENLERIGKMSETLYELFVRLDDGPLIVQVGYLQLKLGLLDDSIDTLTNLLSRAIIRGHEVESMVISNLIESYVKKNATDEAIEVFEKVLPQLDIVGPRGKLYYNIGNAYSDRDRFSEATRCYEMALREPNANRLYVLHNLGYCFFKLGKADIALDYYQMALSVATSRSELAMEEYAISNVYLTLGCSNEARSFLFRAAEHGHFKAQQKVSGFDD